MLLPLNDKFSTSLLQRAVVNIRQKQNITLGMVHEFNERHHGTILKKIAIQSGLTTVFQGVFITNTR